MRVIVPVLVLASVAVASVQGSFPVVTPLRPVNDPIGILGDWKMVVVNAAGKMMRLSEETWTFNKHGLTIMVPKTPKTLQLKCELDTTRIPPRVAILHENGAAILMGTFDLREDRLTIFDTRNNRPNQNSGTIKRMFVRVKSLATPAPKLAITVEP